MRFPPDGASRFKDYQSEISQAIPNPKGGRTNRPAPDRHKI